jgi:hypothetical protein
MSATSAPFGLRAVYSPSGVVRPQAMTILSTYAANILQNQPVKIGTNGTIEAAAIDDRFIGTFCGVEFTDTDGRRRVSNKWTSGTTGTDIIAYVTLDPTMVYEIQSNAALNVLNIGEQFNFTTITAGNATTGLSQLMLDVSSSTTNASLRLIGITPGPDNNWGDTYVIAQVQISEHQNVADRAAY